MISTMQPRRIVLVDDDRNILESVTMALEAEGFAVRSYNDGQSGLAGLLEDPPDLAVLDIKMPRMDGLTLLARLRESCEIPVIFLTSKDSESDEVAGLRHGADDYIKKPFSMRLLLERIRVLLRRADADTAQQNNPLLQQGFLTLDDSRRECRWKGSLIDLTVTEYLLLKALAARPGHVKDREQLMVRAYGPSTYIDDRTIDSHIKRIRRKFKAADSSFNQIETLYGVGYRYRQE